MFTILEQHRYRHDFALFHFVLEEGSVNHGRRCSRIVNGNQVERLYHVRTVMAAERDKDLEIISQIQAFDLRQHLIRYFGCITRHLQQG